MKLLIINSGCGVGSVGHICTDIAQEYEQNGYAVKITYGRDRKVPEKYQKYAMKIGTIFDVYMHLLVSRLFDKHGFGSIRATKKFLKKAEEFNPDIVWIHNVHGYYLNIDLLFNWLKAHPNIEVKWTLHDCWAITGHCAHFASEGCNKWKTCCYNCKLLKKYPKSYIDRSKRNFEKKRALFTGIKNLTIYTPSKWLANLVRESYLSSYKIIVKPNIVDHTIFKPTNSDFRLKNNLLNKIILLGVAFKWTKYKGLETFIELSKMLDNHYIIVLVGLSEKQIALLPKNIIGLKKTANAKELAQIYTAADLYVNPSTEETFSMTTAEAISCGTRAIVYKGTACEEVIENTDSVAVERGTNNLYGAIIDMTSTKVM